ITATQTEDGKKPTDATATAKAQDASEAPVIKPVTEGDKTISGTGVPGANIVVKDKDGNEIGNATVDDEGNWSVAVPDGKEPAEGDTITATQTEDGKKPTDATATVKPAGGTTDPETSDTPTIDQPTEGDKTITGGGVPGASIDVTLPDGTEINTTVDEDGKWKVDVPAEKPLKPGEKITVTQKEDGKEPAKETAVVDKKDSSGGGGGTTPPTPPAPPVDHGGNWIIVPSIPDTPKPEPLESGEHFAFVYGYPDDTMKPDGLITRAEAAAMISRLAGLKLTDDSAPGFSDTPSGWYNREINVMVAMDLMLADDGLFRPNEPITRAEFARALYHIDHRSDKVAPFDDVKGHRFEDAINQAYGNGRINGYPDGTFRPDAPINRAEAARLLNRFAGRSVDIAGLADVVNDVRTFPDVPMTHWAYFEIIEASNSHTYTRVEKDNILEKWNRVLPLLQR
ncbi:MAG: S-layer homology domain-containing protein, partial [Tissierellia bacterium]|nr:S-layer homology domain-containing protein [Tissierellia bacterium]